jgi:hypothetical protein
MHGLNLPAAVHAPDGFRPICIRHERFLTSVQPTAIARLFGQPAARKVGSEGEDWRPKQAARRSALPGVDRRKSDELRRAIQRLGGGDGRQHAGAARAVVDMRGTLSPVVRAIISRIVVMMAGVIVVVPIMIVIVVMAMMAMIVAMMNMVHIAIRVGMNEEAR